MRYLAWVTLPTCANQPDVAWHQTHYVACARCPAPGESEHMLQARCSAKAL